MLPLPALSVRRANTAPSRAPLSRAAALLLTLLVGALPTVACGGGEPEPPPTAPPAPTMIMRGGADQGSSEDASTEEDDETAEEADADAVAAREEDGPEPDPEATLALGDEIPEGTSVLRMPRRTEPMAFDSPEYAIQAFLWWRPENAERDLLLAEEMGFGFVKQIFGWRDIEPEKGNFDWEKTDFIVGTALRYGGVDLIVRLDFQPEWARAGCSDQGPPNNLQDYADFVTAVATRYQGQIAAYQIWNEPNLAREWCDQSPDPAAYAQMLRVAYAAIKAADPAATVISAGLTPTGLTAAGRHAGRPPTWTRLYQAMGGDSEGYFDLLGVHAAGFAAPPETSPEEAAASEAIWRPALLHLPPRRGPARDPGALR